jgi:hypothetical protein
MPVIKNRLEKLNVKDLKTIEVIFNSGGYFSQEHMNILFDNISNQSNWERLKKLVDLNLLKEHLLESSRVNEPVIYQVRQGACKLMNNPDSYFRKKHNKSYIRRALIKARFIVENYKGLYGALIFDNDEKQLFLTAKGYSFSSFPKKKNFNKKTSENDVMIHIEELILDLEKFEQRPEFIGGSEVELLFVYIDKEHPASIKAQINILLENYKYIVKENKKKLGFLIVTDNEKRAELYKKIAAIEMENIFDFSMEAVIPSENSVDIELLRTYAGTVRKYLEYKGKEAEAERVIIRFKNGELKEEIEGRLAQKKPEKLDGLQKNRIATFNGKPIKLLQDEIMNTVDKNGEEGFTIAIGFLNEIMKLNYYGYIKFSSDKDKGKAQNTSGFPDVFTYVVGRKYYTF